MRSMCFKSRKTRPWNLSKWLVARLWDTISARDGGILRSAYRIAPRPIVEGIEEMRGASTDHMYGTDREAERRDVKRADFPQKKEWLTRKKEGALL